MSPSVGHRSPMRRDRSDSPGRGGRSPRRRSPSRRERSPGRHRSSPKARSPVRTSSRVRSPAREKEKTLSRGRSPKRPRSSSPVLDSPSPRTKRLRRVQAEREVDRASDREPGRNGREGDKDRRAQVEKEVDKVSDRERGRNSSRERDKERRNRETSVDRSERRSAKDKKDGGGSRSRHKRSPSPLDHGRSNRHSSHSPSRDRGHSNRNSSRSPSRGRGHSGRHSSRSPARVSRGSTRDEVINPRGDEHRGDERQDEDDSLARMKAAEESLEAKQKEKPSFELSGKLAAETNRVKGVTLLFTEPSDARKPDVRWRLYVFKAGEVLNEPLYIHRQTCYLFGRERRVADIPTDHPSCSKQHAVIQFRQVEVEKPDGMLSKQVRPYLMDLGSTNGTFLNDNRIEPQRYYELFEKDTIKFGNSSREYVILHENSA